MMRTQTKMGSCLLARFLFYSTSFVVLSSELASFPQASQATVITTPDWTAIGAAVAVIVTAIGAVWLKLRALNSHLNSRLDLLLEVVEKKAYAEGGADERERASGEAKPSSGPAGSADRAAK